MLSMDLAELQKRVAGAPKNARGRRIFSKKIKQDIVDYASKNQLDKKRLSQELGICIQTLSVWFKNDKLSQTHGFQSIKIQGSDFIEKAPKKPSKEAGFFPKGILLLGDADSIADFLRGMHAPVSR